MHRSRTTERPLDSAGRSGYQGPMGGVFISYRRTDTDSARLFYSWLREHFGPEQVFWDRQDITPGARFDDVLDERVRSSNALVALIGPDWVRDATDRHRLADPADWLRREIATALELGRLVVPVLMGKAEMVEPGDLPDDLRELPRLQAVQLSDLRVREQLIEALDDVVQPAVRSAVEDTSAQAARLQDVVRRQVWRLQMHAIKLIGGGDADGATEVMHRAARMSRHDRLAPSLAPVALVRSAFVSTGATSQALS
jgi:TIR domain